MGYHRVNNRNLIRCYLPSLITNPHRVTERPRHAQARQGRMQKARPAREWIQTP